MFFRFATKKPKKTLKVAENQELGSKVAGTKIIHSLDAHSLKQLTSKGRKTKIQTLGFSRNHFLELYTFVIVSHLIEAIFPARDTKCCIAHIFLGFGTFQTFYYSNLSTRSGLFDVVWPSRGGLLSYAVLHNYIELKVTFTLFCIVQ